MTQKEASDKISKFRIEREADSAVIVEMARGLIPVLRDAQRKHSADELERLLFIYDVHFQEVKEWTFQNLDEIARLTIEGLDRGNK